MVKSGIIYKIYDRIDKKLVYYGSTEKSLSERLDSHISNYKRYKIGNYHFVTSYLVFDADNYDIMMVERVEFGDIKELRNRERFYIENNICVNIIVPNRTNAEYYKANKDKILEDRVQYYKANKVKIAEQKAEHRKENKEKYNEKFVCVCGGYYTYSHKSHHEKSKKHQAYLTSIQCDKK
tara:strand:- start:15 stop:554 length:540 start_codon:yes stop_codon:yes gene_type:complete